MYFVCDAQVTIYDERAAYSFCESNKLLERTEDNCVLSCACLEKIGPRMHYSGASALRVV